MMLGRDSAEENAMTSWTPEIDYEMNVLSAEANGRHSDVETTGADDKGANGKKRGSSDGKLSNKEVRSRVSNGSVVKSKSDIASKSRKPPAGSRTTGRKTKFDQVFSTLLRSIWFLDQMRESRLQCSNVAKNFTAFFYLAFILSWNHPNYKRAFLLMLFEKAFNRNT